MAAVEIAGIKKLKIYNTVNIKMEIKHPNYYKNLRKLARLRNRDQAISLQASTEDAGRTPGTGQQADEPPSSLSPDGVSGRVGPKGSSLQAGERASAQASSGARINKR